MSTPRARASWALFTLIALFFVLVWSAILFGNHGSPELDAYPTSEAADQHRYHFAVVRAMMEQWPSVDLVNYRSTTSPGYHLALAVVAMTLTDSMMAMQLVSSLATLLLLLVIWRVVARAHGPWPGVVAALPLLTSSYVLGAAIWLTTDNAALLFVALAVGGAIFAAPTPGRLARFGAYASGAVAVRQIHLWCAGAPWIAALTGAGLLGPRLVGSCRLRPAALLVAVPALLAPFALMVWFYVLWGGLTPPAYADIHDRGVNGAAVVVILSLFGVYGIFLLPAILASTETSWRDRIPPVTVMSAAVGAGIVLTLVVPTTYDKAAGRWGGAIWELVRRTPDVADRSLLFPVLAALGAVVLVCALAQCTRRTGWVLGLTLLGWSLAQACNSQAWQRYCEPLVLIFLAWLIAAARPGTPRPRWVWAGPLVLALGLLGLSVIQVYAPALTWSPSE